MIKTQVLNRETALLEDLILGVHAKRDARKNDMSEDEKKEMEKQLETLYTIENIVQAEEYRMTEEDRKSLAGVMERILGGSASAHLTNEKDGQIKVTVFDGIYRSGVIAELEFYKVQTELIPKAARFY